ncbi:F-box-like domain-containing [Fusarium albosuccineum]|uniref:F-box-like domain-containing n=1 Tax=Fusarium albosuccineum TaxID=1237068 RepID=A0A8H4L190_9HYPO|nr:F-box-like domain-containing [Fusarium albosuccineum]
MLVDDQIIEVSVSYRDFHDLRSAFATWVIEIASLCCLAEDLQVPRPLPYVIGDRRPTLPCLLTVLLQYVTELRYLPLNLASDAYPYCDRSKGADVLDSLRNKAVVTLFAHLGQAFGLFNAFPTWAPRSTLFQLKYWPTYSRVSTALKMEGLQLGAVYVCAGDGEILPIVTSTSTCLLSHAVAHMAELESFSLTTHSKWSKCSINSSTIKAILRTLPTSCVNLELDIRTKYANWGCSSGKHWSTHVCQERRRLLPRMHNVRLNLPVTCDEMLGTRKRGDGFTDVRPISLPCMRNLQIDCGSGQEPWLSIIRTLQRVLELEETNAAEVTVLTSNLNQQKPCYSTLLRCHVRPSDGTTTWSFPITQVPPPPDYRGSDVLYMRTDNGDFVTLGTQAPYDLAGGRPWRLLSTGVRLPATFTSDMPWVPDEELGILTEAEWLERYPQNQPVLAINERETGMRLIDAEEREGTEYRCAVEMTPEGWVRPYTGTVQSMLFRETDDRSNLADLYLLGFDTDAALPQPTRGSRPAHFDRMRKLESDIKPFLGKQELGF